MTRIRHRLLWLAMIAGILGCHISSATAQTRRRLQSRAAFAALDSAALADSSSMRAMDATAEHDSVLLNMLAFLDVNVGREFGLHDTRMRRWDGFGSQAHPDLGILVDGEELGGLINEVTAIKGAAGVSNEEAARRVQHILRLLAAHEYAHLMQYRVFGRRFVEDPDSTRAIECAADLIGGMNYWEFLRARYGRQTVPNEAFETARDFGYVVGSTNWLDGTGYPLRENRRLCIGVGIATGGGLSSVLDLRFGFATDSITVQTAIAFESYEPALSNGTITPMGWARVKARTLGATGSVADGSMELTVVRDSSVSRLVRKLADAAVAGDSALRRFRAGPSPIGIHDYLLRQSLPPPWECIVGERWAAEEATCLEYIRTGPAARQEAFESVIRGVEEALAGTSWRRAVLDPEDPSLPMTIGKGHQVAVFVHNGEPYDGKSPQVEVSLSSSEMFPTSQLPPQYQLGLTVRSAAKK